jgi:hypothetical protein
VLSCGSCLTVAQAQTSGADKAVAEMLFDRGLASMRQGDFAQACAQFEQSQSIERGIGTMLYLAECYEDLGRTASAWAMFREAASAARAEGQTERANTGVARAAQLEPQLSKLTLHVPSGNALEGLVVWRNGQQVPEGVWGLATPIDPGEQRVEARAPGHVSWAVTVNLPANGATVSVDVPQLTPLPAAALQPSAAASEPGPAQTVQSEPRPAPSAAVSASHAANSSGNSWQRPLGLVLGSAGIVALGVGTVFGVRAAGKTSDLDKACPGSVCAANSPASKLHDQAQSAATVSNVLVIGGAALLVSGAVVYFTAGPKESVQLSLRGAGAGGQLQLESAF